MKVNPLFLVAFLALIPSYAQAQPNQLLGPVTCTASASPPTIRAEGISDLVGDIVLACVEGPFGDSLDTATLTLDLTVSTNVNITNNINFGSGSDITDAVMIVNENNCDTPTSTSQFATCGAPRPQDQDPQLGQLADVNRIDWSNFAFPVPGAIVPPNSPTTDCNLEPSFCNPPTTTIRVTNLRVLSSQLGVPPPMGLEIVAFVSLTGEINIPINNNVLAVAVPVVGLSRSFQPALNGLQCTDGSSIARVTLTEGFATAFKVEGEPTFTPGAVLTESGYPVPNSNNGAGASQGTRFLLNFHNVPAGVTVSVPHEVDGNGGGNLILDYVDGADSSGAGGTAGVGPGNAQVPLVAGNGFAVFEVGDSEPDAIESADIPVTYSWMGQTSPPDLGASSITAAFAPVGSVFFSDLSAPEPRFVDTTGDPTDLFSIVECSEVSTLFPVTCTATAVPPVVRAEGIAELVGDIVLACILPGSPPILADPYRKTNISVSLNVNVTNNIDFGSAAGVSDAVLVINENNCVTPAESGATYGGGDCSPGRFQDPQFGRLADHNRLEWNEVDLPIPGAIPVADAGSPFPAVTTVRITSIRANASQLGVPGAASFPSTQIAAFVSLTGPTNLAVNNNVLNVAVPILGLIVDHGDPIAGLQCVDGDHVFELTLEEGFATAFKTIGFPTSTPGNTQVESGYFAAGSNNGGGASQATQFLISFFNLPSGVTIELPGVIEQGFEGVSGDALRLEFVGGDGDPVELTVENGTAEAAYEVVDADPFSIESCNLPISVKWDSDTVKGLPAAGSATVAASFGPLSTVFVSDAEAPEPRFIDNAVDPGLFLTVARCTTTLLFPFVTNRSGFDTGVAIANTSEDWLGTSPQTGACTLHYHGSTEGGGAAPEAQTSASIVAGDQLVFTLSAGNPTKDIAGAAEFQGYLIAQCEFQYAHGFAFLTDGFGGIPALAQGYLALVIPVDQVREPGVPNLHVLGETLSH